MKASTAARKASGPEHDPRAAVDYWDQVLDPQNLEHDAGSNRGMSLEEEIAFAQTPDFMAAEAWLAGASRIMGDADGRRWVVDLGAGLGAHTFAFARLGWRVIAIDTSPARLAALRRRAEQAGVAAQVTAMVSSAEALPFTGGSVPALFTKSVLIHVDQHAAAVELARVLAPGGRAALVEPQPGNPFAWLYRKLLAPAAWRGITRYFDPPVQRIVIRGVEMAGGRGDVQPFYLLGFLAFSWQFAKPVRVLFRLSLWLLGPIDRLLFMLPPLRRLAWFGLIRLTKN